MLNSFIYLHTYYAGIISGSLEDDLKHQSVVLMNIYIHSTEMFPLVLHFFPFVFKSHTERWEAHRKMYKAYRKF